MIEDGGGEPGKVSGLEPLFLIGPLPPILHDLSRASLLEDWIPAFPLRKVGGHGNAECGSGITRRVRLGREPERVWRGLHGRKPGFCSTVIPIEDDGQPIGHDRVPTVFWGSDEPGAGNGSSRTVP